MNAFTFENSTRVFFGGRCVREHLAGLPTTLRELGVDENTPLAEIAGSVPLMTGSYGKLTHQDVLEILEACY